MSYARWVTKSCDVYVYDDTYGGTICSTCRLNDGKDTLTKTHSEMVRHMFRHRMNGDIVPQSTITSLLHEPDNYPPMEPPPPMSWI